MLVRDASGQARRLCQENAFFFFFNENYPIQKGLFCGWFQEQLLETARDILDPQQMATHHQICHVNYKYNFIT